MRAAEASISGSAELGWQKEQRTSGAGNRGCSAHSVIEDIAGVPACGEGERARLLSHGTVGIGRVEGQVTPPRWCPQIDERVVSRKGSRGHAQPASWRRSSASRAGLWHARRIQGSGKELAQLADGVVGAVDGVANGVWRGEDLKVVAALEGDRCVAGVAGSTGKVGPARSVP